MSINSPTVPPTTLLTTPIVGMEVIQRSAFYVLFEGLNNALNELSAYWASFDLEFDTVTGRSTSPTLLESVPPENFHEGHKPSLVSSEPSNYPNVAVFVSRADPSGYGSDESDSWTETVDIETMIKGDDEDTTNRRVQRMCEAVVLCIRRNPTLGMTIQGLEETPSVEITELYAVRVPSQGGAYQGQYDQGARFLWQGAGISFRVLKDSALPSSGPSTFAEASQINHSQYIDQG